MTSLDQIGIGQRASITSIAGSDVIVQRLLEMGLLAGEVVRVMALAPLGDPIQILVRDFRLSLRRSEAARIQVVPLA